MTRVLAIALVCVALALAPLVVLLAGFTVSPVTAALARGSIGVIVLAGVPLATGAYLRARGGS